MTIEEMADVVRHPIPGAVVHTSQREAVKRLAHVDLPIMVNAPLEQQGLIVPGTIYWRMSKGSSPDGLIPHTPSGFSACPVLTIPEEVS